MQPQSSVSYFSLYKVFLYFLWTYIEENGWKSKKMLEINATSPYATSKFVQIWYKSAYIWNKQ